MKHGDLVVYGLALAIASTGWRVIRAKVEAKPIRDEWHVAIEGACPFQSTIWITLRTKPLPSGSETGHLVRRHTPHQIESEEPEAAA